MRWVIALLMQFGQGLNALHFNVRLALFGMAVCGAHTYAALALLSRALIPASTAEQLIDFSMSGTVFLMVGITVSGLIPTYKGKENAEPAAPSDAPDKNFSGLVAHSVCARCDHATDLAGPQLAHAGNQSD